MIETFTLIAGLLALLSVTKELRNKKLLFWVFIVPLIIFDGLRWEMGTDWTSYYGYFQRADVYNQPGFEPGFIFYTSLIRSFTDQYSIYLLITTAIIYVGIFYSIFRITGGSFLSIFYLTGIVPWYSGALRQMIACVFFVLALQAIFARRPFRYLLLMVGGLMFHTTVIVYFPVYLLYGVSPGTFLMIFAGTALVSVFAKDLIRVLNTLMAFYFRKDFSSTIGGTLALSDPLFGFLRKALTLTGFIAFAGLAKSSPRLDEVQWKNVLFALMLTSFSIILYYIGTYAIAHVSSRLDIYPTIIGGAVLIGVLDRALSRRINRIALFAFVAVLVGVIYTRLEFMDLFHPYSSVFYNYDLRRDLY